MFLTTFTTLDHAWQLEIGRPTSRQCSVHGSISGILRSAYHMVCVYFGVYCCILRQNVFKVFVLINRITQTARQHVGLQKGANFTIDCSILLIVLKSQIYEHLTINL